MPSAPLEATLYETTGVATLTLKNTVYTLNCSAMPKRRVDGSRTTSESIVCVLPLLQASSHPRSTDVMHYRI